MAESLYNVKGIRGLHKLKGTLSNKTTKHSKSKSKSKYKSTTKL